MPVLVKKNGDFEIDGKVFSTTGHGSDQDWGYWYGGKGNIAGQSDLKATNLNLGLKYRGLSTRFLYEDYKMQSINSFG